MEITTTTIIIVIVCLKIKRNSEKKDIPSKKTIIQDTFGLSK